MRRDERELDVLHVGAPLAELEPARYAPRHPLTRALQRYDVVQVVAGGPALALAASQAQKPITLLVASLMRLERKSIVRTYPMPRRVAASAMLAPISHLERVAVRVSDEIFVYNSEMRSRIQAMDPRALVNIAPAGVDTQRWRPSGNGWNRQGAIVAFGRLNEPRKAFDRIVRAYGKLNEEFPACPPLILAGRGVLLPQVKGLIDKLGLHGRIRVMSDLSDVEAVGLIQEASVFWQASHEEGYGFAVLEAMACGIPVVATETAGTLETIVHAESGMLVPQSGDVEAEFAKVTLSILRSESQLPNLARKRVLENFSTERTLEKYLQAYDRLSGRARTATGLPTQTD